MLIRAEKSFDQNDVFQINESVFKGAFEARLVDGLHSARAIILSLVADINGKVVGYVIFSEVQIEVNPDHKRVLSMIPLVVLPGFQKQGIGSSLVRQGLKQCKFLGYDAVVVLGSTDFYARFGFKPAKQVNLKFAYPVPTDLFMVMELKDNGLANSQGTVHYHAAFDEFSA